ncbi:hypothetical protein Tco_0071125 [Tanacetum coccineum]
MLVCLSIGPVAKIMSGSVVSSSRTSVKSTPSTLGHISRIILKTSALTVHFLLVSRKFIRISALNLLDRTTISCINISGISAEIMKALRQVNVEVLDGRSMVLEMSLSLWHNRFPVDIGRAVFGGQAFFIPIFSINEVDISLATGFGEYVQPVDIPPEQMLFCFLEDQLTSLCLDYEASDVTMSSV